MLPVKVKLYISMTQTDLKIYFAFIYPKKNSIIRFEKCGIFEQENASWLNWYAV